MTYQFLYHCWACGDRFTRGPLGGLPRLVVQQHLEDAGMRRVRGDAGRLPPTVVLHHCTLSALGIAELVGATAIEGPG